MTTPILHTPAERDAFGALLNLLGELWEIAPETRPALGRRFLAHRGAVSDPARAAREEDFARARHISSQHPGGSSCSLPDHAHPPCLPCVGLLEESQ